LVCGGKVTHHLLELYLRNNDSKTASAASSKSPCLVNGRPLDIEGTGDAERLRNALRQLAKQVGPAMPCALGAMVMPESHHQQSMA
jgi:hypothetical protein